MAKRPPGYWKRYYREHRQQLLDRQKKRSEEATEEQKEKRKKYNKEWYEKNREYVKEYSKQRSSKRREWANAKYASDPEFRRKRFEEVKRYRERHPHARVNRLLRSLGYSGTYESLLESQDGRCAICGRTEADSRGHRLHVDHCHATGRVRGLLCGDCNLGLGKFGDSPDLLAKAAVYLRPRKRKKGNNR